MVPPLGYGTTIGLWCYHCTIMPPLGYDATIGLWHHYWAMVPPLGYCITIGLWCHHWTMVPLGYGATIELWCHHRARVPPLGYGAILAMECSSLLSTCSHSLWVSSYILLYLPLPTFISLLKTFSTLGVLALEALDYGHCFNWRYM